MDERNRVLAHNLVNYSVKVKKGEKVYIQLTGNSTMELGREIVKAVYEAGGMPFLHIKEMSLQRELIKNCSEEQLKLMAEVDCLEMNNMDCYIGISGSDNMNELSDVDSKKIDLYSRLYSKPVHSDIRVNKTKWVIAGYPNNAMAQLMGTSLESFEDFYYKVCNLDYSKMAEAMKPLVELMKNTDKVRIVANDTDISFSIKGIGAVPCAGEFNIPDGEVYSAPVKDSVNGVITYNTPSVYHGFTFENVSLTFENGKIIKATANNTEKINEIFDTDEGARYVGEFAIGVNPYVVKPMKDILFDEKIMGSIHFTPGSCYEDAPNGNDSAVHWDLVQIQTPEYGGGEIYFDDVLIRKDGRFVIPELECLNPENLV